MSDDKNQENLRNLLELSQVYKHSLNICDPIDFAFRQKNLLSAVCEHLLAPLYQDEKKKMKEKGENLEKFFKEEK